jgi:serine/threonine protein phosphatase 1
MSFWSKLTAGFLPSSRWQAKGKPGARLFAVGDIHGRLDLLNSLLDRIEAELAATRESEKYVVFLGDLIDRGPDSAGVVERLRTYQPAGTRVILLAGNHEEVLLRVLDAEPGLLESWLTFGGAECVQSYGLDPTALGKMDEQTAAEALRQAVPAEHVAFIESFGDTFKFGDYLLVHAGIRPGVPLHEQVRKDMRWIREPFLSDAGHHDFLVVHGHTVVDAVEERGNRIAIDTGAYRTNVLTALVIEETGRRYIAVNHQPGIASQLNSPSAWDNEPSFAPMRA